MGFLKTELALRLYTAIIFIPIVLFALKINGDIFLAGMAIISCIALYELIKLWRDSSILSYVMLAITVFGLIAITYIGYGKGGFDRGLTLFLAICATDTCAYIFGRTIGGPKVAPKLSPKKTWAGLVGAMLGAAAVFMWFYPKTLLEAFLLGCVFALLAQTGDFIESALKRRAAVKDSGRILPGHGGILDRIDGLLLAAPAYLLFFQLKKMGVI